MKSLKDRSALMGTLFEMLLTLTLIRYSTVLVLDTFILLNTQ